MGGRRVGGDLAVQRLVVERIQPGLWWVQAVERGLGLEFDLRGRGRRRWMDRNVEWQHLDVDQERDKESVHRLGELDDEHLGRGPRWQWMALASGGVGGRQPSCHQGCAWL